MSKNVVISYLIIVIAILIGIIMITNYNWFSQDWLIGLGVVVGGIATIGILSYLKIRK